MKQCLVYGNCQAMAIQSFLARHPDFLAEYSILEMKPVQLLNEDDLPQLERAVAEADLFIHQPVSDRYKGMPQLSTDYIKGCLQSSCQIISFPVAYFTGYNPEVSYLKDGSRQLVSEPFGYHDLNILRLYAEGESAAAVVQMIQSDSFYDLDDVEQNLEKTLSELSRREAELDIQLAQFIRENFRYKKLFHIFNHPSPIILEHVVELILGILNISPQNRFADLFRNADVLARSSFMIYPSLAKALKLDFVPAAEYWIEKEILSLSEVVEGFFKFYDSRRDEVADFLAYGLPRTQ